MEKFFYEIDDMLDILTIHFRILVIAVLVSLMGQLVHVIGHASQLSAEFHLFR